MKKNKEIEIKLLFKNKKKIVSMLGVESQKKISLYDTYYGLKNSDMSNKHSLIRIREEKNGKAELTYKGKTRDKKNIWHRIELNTDIGSPEVMKKILNKLGFEQISEYKNEKEYYNYQGLEICFAKFTLPAKLSFMEIEDENEVKIRNLVTKLGNNVKEVGEEIFAVFDKARKKKK